MKRFFKVLWAEAKKQHKNYFHNKSVYVSLFLWPVLSFFTTYYSFQSFQFSMSKVSYLTEENVLVYLILGYMCMSFFRSLVNSSWKFSFERTAGTLEMIYLSPASRFAVLLGNTLSSLLESVAAMVIFSGILIAMNHSQLYIRIIPCMVLILLLLGMSASWGIFLNAMFLFSRDMNFLYTVLEEPMETFAGVRIPHTIYPHWAKAISFIFPLTYILEAVRRVLLNDSTLYEVRGYLGIGIVIIIVFTVVTAILIKKAEQHIRITGNLTLF